MPIQVSFRQSSSATLVRADVHLDENREIVVKKNYTLAIIRKFSDPDLLRVAIPVIYNICMDYGEDNVCPLCGKRIISDH